jgi:pilus assembly protein Flp/PilA
MAVYLLISSYLTAATAFAARLAARALAPQRGQGLAEYAIVLALIAVVVVGAVTLLGQAITGVFESITRELQGLGSGGNGN